MRGLRAAALAAAFVAMPVSVVGQKTVPVANHKLENGLKVVLSEAHSAPTAVVAIYYGIGFRIELRKRTGFAHLFEHAEADRMRGLAITQENLTNQQGVVKNEVRVNVTPADVQRTARTYLDPQKMGIVIVGHRKAIADQIAPFGTIQP